MKAAGTDRRATRRCGCARRRDRQPPSPPHRPPGPGSRRVVRRRALSAVSSSRGRAPVGSSCPGASGAARRVSPAGSPRSSTPAAAASCSQTARLESSETTSVGCMARAWIRDLSGAAAAVVLVAALAACGGNKDDKPSRVAEAEAAATVIGSPDSECDLPILVTVPENWYVEAFTAETVQLADDETLTSPGGFNLRCALLGSRDGTLATISIFVAPPQVAGGLTTERLVERFIRAANGEVSIKMRDVTVAAGKGIEGVFVDTRGPRGPVQRRVFVLPTPNGTVVVTNDGGLDQETVDKGFTRYEFARDSLRLRD